MEAVEIQTPRKSQDFQRLIDVDKKFRWGGLMPMNTDPNVKPEKIDGYVCVGNVYYKTQTDLSEYVDQFRSRLPAQIFDLLDNSNTLFDVKESKTLRLIENSNNSKCQYMMYKGDTFDVVNHYLDENQNISNRSCAILNFANAIGVGGGYKNGAGAQEEMLVYRSDLADSLHNVKAFITKKSNSWYHKPDVFEIVGNEKKQRSDRKYIPFNRCIYSPLIDVYGCLISDNMIQLTTNQVIMSVNIISAAAP